jgi:abnormal spindle-like microcephaly-associated protein
MNMMVVARKNEIRAAKVIQSRFRGYLVQRETMNVMMSAVQIQRVFRGHVARIDYYIELVDIVIVQSVARMWMARQAATERKKSIIRIQSAIRMNNMKTLFSQSRAELSAAIVLQRFVRGCLARASIRRGRAATKLQKTWRCYTKHVDYMMAILSCIQIQAASRRFIAVSIVAQRKAAVVRLQSIARRAIVKRHLTRQSSSAIKIQATTRMFLLRSKFLVHKVAITQVQRVVRGHIQRADLALQHFAATQIQGAWRAYVSVTYFICMELSAVTIQSLFRGWLGRKQAESCRDEHLAISFCKEHSARIIQCSYREYSRRMLEHTSARKIALCWKHCQMQKAFRKMAAGFVQLQGAFRGFSVRAKDPLAASRLQRIEAAKNNSTMNPDLRLCNKTKRALNRLRKSSGLSDILDSIQFLERATRYSHQCCRAFTRAEAPDILFSLVRSCNRSLPHVELLEWILLTLSNVARFDELLDSVATPTGVRIFLDLLQMFRDKEVVFSLSVALLWKSLKANVDLMVRFIADAKYCTEREWCS